MSDVKSFFSGHTRWGGRPWPPIILAGTEARPTKISGNRNAKLKTRNPKLKT